jgi:hypothetical protein
MTVVTVLRPERDGVEQLLSGWADELISALGNETAVQVVDRRGPGVSLENIRDALATSDFVVFFGHGTSDGWGGGEPPLDELINETDLAAEPTSCIVAIACYSARRFGRTALTQRTAEGFIGFSERLLSSTVHPKVFGRAFTVAIRDLVAGSRSADLCANILAQRFSATEQLYGPGGALDREIDAIWVSTTALVNRLALRAYPRDL